MAASAVLTVPQYRKRRATLNSVCTCNITLMYICTCAVSPIERGAVEEKKGNNLKRDQAAKSASRQ